MMSTPQFSNPKLSIFGTLPIETKTKSLIIDSVLFLEISNFVINFSVSGSFPNRITYVFLFNIS